MNQSLIRSVLKIGAGYFIAKGFMDQATAEIIIAGLVALFGVAWGVFHRDSAPPFLLALALAAPAFAIGCVEVNPAHVAGDHLPAYIAASGTISNTIASAQATAAAVLPVIATAYPPAAIATPFVAPGIGLAGMLLGFLSGLWATKKSRDANKLETVK